MPQVEPMSTSSGQFCPVCKFRNEPGALICGYCGAMLEIVHDERPTTSRLDGDSQLFSDSEKNPFDTALVPPTGLGIYLENTAPVTIIEEKEFILGRKVEGTGGLVVDLIPFGAFQMGVSRKHAMVRETKGGYELTDLNSTNGTWIEEKQLLPNQPYPLASGATIRLGRMRLLVLYNR
jgi:pSer/pThr/pTyr-binding forkhead associated (FHA) protein